VGCGSVGMEGNGGIAGLGLWLRLFFKVIFILKYIKIIFLKKKIIFKMNI
jgi:hypothetical protein